MTRKQPSSRSTGSRLPLHHTPTDDGCDASLLSSCEQGGGSACASSEDNATTASLSITQDGSFLSSFSQDTPEPTEFGVMDMLHWNVATPNGSHNNNSHMNPSESQQQHPLRHRRALHHPDDLHLLEEEGELCSYSEDEDEHDSCDEHHSGEFGPDPYESENSKHHPPSRSSKLHSFRRRKLKWVGVAAAAFLGLIVLVLAPILQGRRWRLPSQRRTREILQQLRQPQPKTMNTNLTLRVRGKHVDLLHRAVETYARCPVVTHIQIDWTCPEQDMPDFSLLPTDKLLLRPSGDDGNNEDIPTTALLLLDEHVILHCRDVENALQEWKQDPSRVVGLVPHNKQQVQAPLSYSLVSDAAVMVHRFYWRSLPRRGAAADRCLPQHCQHVVLSAWATALSHASPVVMVSNVMLLPDWEDESWASLSSSPIHVPEDCARHAARAAGLPALPETGGTVLGGATFWEGE